MKKIERFKIMDEKKPETLADFQEIRAKLSGKSVDSSAHRQRLLRFFLRPENKAYANYQRHHCDGDETNDDKENILLCTHLIHRRLHAKCNYYYENGKWYKECCACKGKKLLDEFYFCGEKCMPRCKPCDNKRRVEERRKKYA